MVYISTDFDMFNELKKSASVHMKVFSIPDEADMIVVDKDYITVKEDVKLKEGDIIIVIKNGKIYKIMLDAYLL